MSATAPNSSSPRHHITTLLRVPLLPNRLSVFTKSSMTSCCFTATPNLDAKAKKDPNAMKFNPPNWMSTRSTQCPLWVKYVMVSTLISPVTQVALVAVNKASAQGMPPSTVVIWGMLSSHVPAAISTRKLMMNTMAGCTLTRGKRDPGRIHSVRMATRR